MALANRHSNTQMFQGFSENHASSRVRQAPGGKASGVFCNDIQMQQRQQTTTAKVSAPSLHRSVFHNDVAMVQQQQRGGSPAHTRTASPRSARSRGASSGGGMSRVFHNDDQGQQPSAAGGRQQQPGSAVESPWSRGSPTVIRRAPKQNTRGGSAGGMFRMDSPGGENVDEAAAAARVERFAEERQAAVVQKAALERQQFLDERAAKLKFVKEAERRQKSAIIQQNNNVTSGENLGSLLAKAELEEPAPAAPFKKDTDTFVREQPTFSGDAGKGKRPKAVKGRGAPRCAAAAAAERSVSGSPSGSSRSNSASRSKAKGKPSSLSVNVKGAMLDRRASTAKSNAEARREASARTRREASAKAKRIAAKKAGAAGVGHKRNHIKQNGRNSSRVLAPPGGASSFAFA